MRFRGVAAKCLWKGLILSPTAVDLGAQDICKAAGAETLGLCEYVSMVALIVTGSSIEPRITISASTVSGEVLESNKM